MTSNNNNNDRKDCEGCTTNKFCTINPSHTDPKTNQTIICPCTNCIVKAICEGGDLICEEYLEYVDSIKQYEATCNSQFES